MSNGKTIRELMDEASLKAGAQNYKGHDYMDLMRFDENTRHMIVFTVLTHDSPVGVRATRCACSFRTRGMKKPWITRNTVISKSTTTPKSEPVI